MAKKWLKKVAKKELDPLAKLAKEKLGLALTQDDNIDHGEIMTEQVL